MTSAKTRIITLAPGDFGRTCVQLQDIVAVSGYIPDYVVGILSGGRYVGERIFTDVSHYYTKLSRPSTNKIKGQLFRQIIRLLPQFLCDWLRLRESRSLEVSSHRRLSTREAIEAAVDSQAKLVSVPSLACCKRILVVDDAVDSGLTLAAVMRAINKAYPQAEVRSAAITVTTDEPIVHPDYKIYNNHTLIRFPWAADSKTKVAPELW